MDWFNWLSRPITGRLLRGTVGLALWAVLVACSNKDKPANADASQVVAQVNDSEISIHQVQTLMQMQPALVNQLGEGAAGKVLDSLIEQELAAQAARKSGLDTTPKVLQAMELAKREVLARAYQDQLADKAALPDTTAVDRYYDEHPELFAKRRQYSLQETLVQATPEQLKPLLDQLASVSSVEALNKLVAASGLPNSSRNSVQWAEGLDMALLPRLAALQNGQSITALRPDGLVILTLLNAEDAPVSRALAGRAIQSAIVSGRRRELIQQGMATLRQAAKIERKGALAAAASAPQGAAASSP